MELIENKKMRSLNRRFLSFVFASLLLSNSGKSQLQIIDAPAGFDNAVAPFIPFESLKKVGNPVLLKNPTNGNPSLRVDLTNYVSDLNSAIQLGKSFFWEMQAGSDNRTACASCHFQAGADNRSKGQIHSGSNGKLDDLSGTKSHFASENFPFTSGVEDRDDIAGSQGVRQMDFVRLRYSKPDAVAPELKRSGESQNGPSRQVTGRNTPSVINAIFNHRNFWDGRAQAEFNGVNPFGNRDTNAHVWEALDDGSLHRRSILIANASTASQAVGPALSGVEMSASGRSFPHLGRKLFRSKPLGLQQVSPTDSVLGDLADSPKGLNTSYEALLQRSFQPRWWSSPNPVMIGNTTNSLMEANFSLFWGIAIMLYEATLVSDDSPLDQFFDSSRNDLAVLEAAAARIRQDMPGITVTNILNGLALFEQDMPPNGNGLGCIHCHAGPETTSASVRHLTGVGLGNAGVDVGDLAVLNAGFDLRLERMFGSHPPVPAGIDQVVFNPTNYIFQATRSNGVALMPPVPINVSVYDTGWYNIGVRPTAEDLGLDGLDPFGNSLAWTRLFQALPEPGVIKVFGGALPKLGAGTPTFTDQVLNAVGFPILSGPLLKNEATDVAGSFKVSSLRNIEFTGPYFHNGGQSTLRQVVAFYKRGGDFDNPTLAPEMRPFPLSGEQANDLVAFMMALTDERVRWQRAPFDHPQLLIPEGEREDSEDKDEMLEIPAVGRAGADTPLERFLKLNPFDP